MTAPRPQRYRWVVLALLLLPFAARLSVTPSLGILMPEIASTFEIGPAGQGLLVGVSAMANVVLGIPAAWLFSRYPPGRLYLASCAAATLLVALVAMAPSFPVLFAAQAAAGLAYLTHSTAGALLARQWFPPREQALISGFHMATAGLIEVVAFNAAPPALAATGSYRPILLSVAALWLVSTVLWLLFSKTPPAETIAPRSLPDARVFVPVLRHPVLWLAALGIFGANLAWASYVSFWPAHMLHAHATPLEQSGFVLGIISLAQAPASLASGWAATRWPVMRAPFLILCGLIMTATTLGFIATQSHPLLVALAAVNGVTWAFLPLLAALPYQLGLSHRQLAVGTSFVWSFGSLGLLAGPPLTGLVAEHLGDVTPGLALAALFGLLVLISSRSKPA